MNGMQRYQESRPRRLEIVGQDGRVYDMNEPDGYVEVLLAGYESGLLAPPTEDEIVGQFMPLLMNRNVAASPQRQQSLIQRASQLMRRPGGREVMTAPVQALTRAIQGLGGPRVTEVAVSPTPRYTVQPITRTLVAAGATLAIRLNSALDQELVFLVIGEDVAPIWSINSVALSGDSLFAETGAVPATTMTPAIAGRTLSLKRRTVKGGQPIIVDVTNKDGADHVFEGVLYSIAIDENRCPT